MAQTQLLYTHAVSNNGDGTFTVLAQPSARYYIYDVEDNPGDDLSIIGDISGDTINIYDSLGGFILSTQAFATNSNGVIINYLGAYRLFSYNTYTGGQVVSASEDNDFAIRCFTAGVQIETSRGPAAIESLAVGDVTLTASGAERRIIWIGQRTIDCSGENSHAAPVRIRANAFGAGVPERDVYLSPGHPVAVKQDGVEVLVPIMNLINGTTIERSSMQSVTYWHIELDQHDVLLADGLPAESFFDMGTRGWFENDLDDILANPDLVPAGQHGRCLDVALDGPLVEAQRRRLADLFYADLSAQCAWPNASQYDVG